MTTPEDIDHADILFAIAMTLASQHTTGLINKEKAIESIKEHAQSLITLHTQKARIDTAKTIQKNTEQAFINDMQVVEIFRDKDNKVISITNTTCENYIDHLTNPTEAGEK